MKKKDQSFLGGAVILTMAVAITKVIGFLYKIPLGNLLDREGMAHFYAAYNIYNLLLVLSTAGLPLALSRMVSEAEALGLENQKHRVFAAALELFCIMGAVCSAAMFLLARPLTALLHDSLAYWPVRVLSPAVFCVCVMAAIRGYTQGQSNMKPTAVSEIIESSCKLLVGLTAAWLLLQKGAPVHIAAAGAIAGVTTGTAMGMVAMVIYLLGRRGRRPSADVPQRRRYILRRLLSIGIPITIGASSMSLITLLDQAIVMGTLQGSLGLSEVDAAALYGEYTFGMNLFSLPSSFIYPVTISLIPAISAAMAHRNLALAKRNTDTAFRITALLALPAGIGLSVLAGPILSLFYPAVPETAAAATYHLRILGIASIFVCLMAVTDGILQAYGKEKVPLWTLLCGGIVKIVSNYIMVSNPAIGIRGAPISTLMCYVLITVLNLIAIRRLLPVRVQYAQYFVRPLAAALVMSVAAQAGYGLILRVYDGRAAVLLAVLIGAVVYATLVLAWGAVRRQDILALPKGEKIADRLHIR
ncbi:MAG: polysaccharide biosynthesis protein [Clostridiales bacterium]|nr:polysaccharide biosynthesis protein [Candidatus Cacconaster stercorequi]